MAGAVAVPALAQDATHFAPPEISWGKPSAKHAESADAAGTAQRVDPGTLSACGNGKVLTLSATGTFACTDTITKASYANNANDANMVGGKTVNQIASTLASSGYCNLRSVKGWGNDQWVPSGTTFAGRTACYGYDYRYICVSGTWALSYKSRVDDCK